MKDEQQPDLATKAYKVSKEAKRLLAASWETYCGQGIADSDREHFMRDVREIIASEVRLALTETVQGYVTRVEFAERERGEARGEVFRLREERDEARSASLEQHRLHLSTANVASDYYAQLSEARAEIARLAVELDEWKRCANCHESLQAPGLCASGKDEAEKGYMAMLDEAITERDKSNARATAAEQREQALRDELEVERMRLAACSTASIQNTESSRGERIDQNNPYWSVAYSDVCRAVDREMSHREQLQALRDWLREKELHWFGLARALRTDASDNDSLVKADCLESCARDVRALLARSDALLTAPAATRQIVMVEEVSDEGERRCVPTVEDYRCDEGDCNWHGAEPKRDPDGVTHCPACGSVAIIEPEAAPAAPQEPIMQLSDEQCRKFTHWVVSLQAQGYKLAMVKDGHVEAVQVFMPDGTDGPPFQSARPQEPWRPIETIPSCDTLVWLWTPPHRLSDRPDQEPDIRVSTHRHWTWPTTWQPVSIPAHSSAATPGQEPKA